MILVSACLAGIKCRYDGKDNADPQIVDLVRNGLALPVCPEQLGGLPTPRTPAEIRDGRVIDKAGFEVTQNFLKGAEETLKIARLTDCKTAIFKQHSPSCGFGSVYDGSHSGLLKHGNGITANLLHKNGISIFTENNIPVKTKIAET